MGAGLLIDARLLANVVSLSDDACDKAAKAVKTGRCTPVGEAASQKKRFHLGKEAVQHDHLPTEPAPKGEELRPSRNGKRCQIAADR